MTGEQLFESQIEARRIMINEIFYAKELHCCFYREKMRVFRGKMRVFCEEFTCMKEEKFLDDVLALLNF